MKVDFYSIMLWSNFLIDILCLQSHCTCFTGLVNHQGVVMATQDVVIDTQVAATQGLMTGTQVVVTQDVTDTQVAATQGLMTGTQDVVVGTPAVVVDTQGAAVTDTQKTGDIIIILNCTTHDNRICSIVYSHCTMYLLMSTFQAVHFFLCAVKKNEDRRSMVLEHLLQRT